MKIRELAVPDAYEVIPVQHGDDRGVFVEWFRDDLFTDAVGHRLDLRQANISVSAKGSVRGIHFADVPPSQAKYVTCPSGAAARRRGGHPGRARRPSAGGTRSCSTPATAGRSTSAEGLGHVFMALTDGAVISYLCSAGYDPGREHGVHPLDPAIGIEWPADVEPLLSPKDLAAPTLAEAEAAGLLPSYDECQAFYAELRSR